MTRYRDYRYEMDDYEFVDEDKILANYENIVRCEYNSDDFYEILSVCLELHVHYEKKHTYVLYNEDLKKLYICWDVTGGDEWKSCLEKCSCLMKINISGCDEVPKEIYCFNKIKCLTLFNCRLDNDVEYIFNMTWLNTLVIERSKLDYLPDCVGKLNNLEYLSLMYTGIKELPETLGKLSKLRYLGLNGLDINDLPVSIYNLKHLESLFMGQTKLRELPKEITNLKKLKVLAIWETPLQELPEYIIELKNLEELYLGRTKGIKQLPEQIGKLKRLRKLYLDGTSIKGLPASFGELVNLEDLILSNTRIQKFPKMKRMPNLKKCRLCEMTLERIPEEFIYTDMEVYLNDNYREEGIIIENTKLLCQPISLFEHDKEFIRAYYEEEKIHLNETKIVFLGDGEAGKSHIIRRIYEEGQKVEAIEYQATPGIDIVAKQCRIGNEHINLQLWDFGGQDILHSMHRFFLTDRTLYVIVVNARDNTQNERARYWLNNVKSFADGCPVIIVLNKIDQNKSAGLNETLLKSDYPQIKEILKMSALVDEKNKFNDLIEKISETVKTFDSYGMDFPVSWNRIKNTLTEMQCNYIVDQDYRGICEENGVADKQIQNWLLEWFHDLGVSFNYRKKDVMLGGYMVLKPQWITNAIYIILFNAKEYAVNGVISKTDIVNLLENPPKAVENIKYSISEVPYIINVLRRFDISYKIDDEHEFIPMLCSDNEYEDVREFIENGCLEYFMEYQYLPNNVLHKLMIRMRDDLQTDMIWLTGMVLKSRGNHISAVIRIHENRLEIYIKSDNQDIIMPKEYLSEIREYLSNINRELGLVATDMIVYKENGMREEIRYDDLLVHLKAGRKEYFSSIMRNAISVKKILGTVETNMEHLQWLIENKDQLTEEQIRLILLNISQASYADFENELIVCCSKLQGNYLVRTEGDENDNNTYLRDLLQKSIKYAVYDQTLNGSSSRGKAAGELDLKVCIKNDVEEPLCVVEALKLGNVNKKKIKEHIDKIYCYDTWGSKCNYLVIYVHSPNFEGFCKRYQKYLEQFQYPLEVETEVEEREKDSYTEIRLYDTVLKRHGKRTMITHVVVNMV